jgi:Transcriptional repressor TCF25
MDNKIVRSIKFNVSNMSSRAIRALRGDSSLLPVVVSDRGDDSEDEVSEEGDNEGGTRKSCGVELRRQSAFASMIDSDVDDSTSEIESSAEGDGQIEAKIVDPLQGGCKAGIGNAIDLNQNGNTKEIDNLDALLDEFKAKDTKISHGTLPNLPLSSSPYHEILDGMDRRDLDFEYTTRTSVLTAKRAPSAKASTKKNRQTLLFGPAREGWLRPPHYVGGGIGMSSYDCDNIPLPWPYNRRLDSGTEDTSGVGERHWFTFIHSEIYRKELHDYMYIQQTGDVNTLALFVAHHPFATAALLQLSTVMHQTNHSVEGLSLLRRCLWIYECSSLLSFARDLDGFCFIDTNRPENETFFKALFRLVQISHIAR